ncbi:MAG: DUF4160 domain-containing protein [Chloroflexota bacterium]|nr:DUF4160 domain-containing protein [Chloroflexota bacterium]
MPRISQFFGITIAMFYNDHSPPHFHAMYNWDKARNGVPLDAIEPLS